MNKSKEINQSVQIPKNIFFVLEKQLVPITRQTTSIGRHPTNDLIINDPRVSRWHAQLRFEENQFVIHDTASTFGTFLNSEKIEQAAVKTGDTISFAQTPVLFIDRSSKIIKQTYGTTGMLVDED